MVRRGGLPRVHLFLIGEIINNICPKSILEVRCGNGINLFSWLQLASPTDGLIPKNT